MSITEIRFGWIAAKKWAKFSAFVSKWLLAGINWQFENTTALLKLWTLDKIGKRQNWFIGSIAIAFWTRIFTDSVFLALNPCKSGRFVSHFRRSRQVSSLSKVQSNCQLIPCFVLWRVSLLRNPGKCLPDLAFGTLCPESLSKVQKMVSTLGLSFWATPRREESRFLWQISCKQEILRRCAPQNDGKKENERIR